MPANVPDKNVTIVAMSEMNSLSLGDCSRGCETKSKPKQNDTTTTANRLLTGQGGSVGFYNCNFVGGANAVSGKSVVLTFKTPSTTAGVSSTIAGVSTTVGGIILHHYQQYCLHYLQ
jgi:hypothetical protein